MNEKRIEDMVGGWSVDDREWDEFLRAKGITRSLKDQEKDSRLLAAIAGINVEDVFAETQSKKRILREVCGYEELKVQGGYAPIGECGDARVGNALKNGVFVARKRVSELNREFLDYRREKELKVEQGRLIADRSYVCGCMGGRE